MKKEGLCVGRPSRHAELKENPCEEVYGVSCLPPI